MNQLQPERTSFPLKPLTNLAPVVFPSPMVRVDSATRDLEAALKQNAASSEAVNQALQMLAQSLPFHPPPQVVDGGIWGLQTPKVRIDSHLNSTFDDACRNIGVPLCNRERYFLENLIQHHCGWSATPKQHLNAKGFEYVNRTYPYLGPLRPVLDSVVWPEDAPCMPPSFRPTLPSYMLLVSDTGYFLYNYWASKLCKAGNTLEEVFYGMRDMKDIKYPCYGGWNSLEKTKDLPIFLDQCFPRYNSDPEDGHWILREETQEIPEPQIDSRPPTPGLWPRQGTYRSAVDRHANRVGLMYGRARRERQSKPE
jgi:hypothetical protein